MVVVHECGCVRGHALVCALVFICAGEGVPEHTNCRCIVGCVPKVMNMEFFLLVRLLGRVCAWGKRMSSKLPHAAGVGVSWCSFKRNTVGPEGVPFLVAALAHVPLLQVLKYVESSGQTLPVWPLRSFVMPLGPVAVVCVCFFCMHW
jgi:hypothetical protein